VLDAEYVGSETGSLMGSPWGYVKDNHSDESLKKVIEIFKHLIDYAEKCGAKIAIEGAYAHVAYSPKRIREILDAIKSNNLKVTIDLYNYLYIGNYQKKNDISDSFTYIKKYKKEKINEIRR
jgi:sugar phosphate isomerase/epimerase